MSLLLSSSLLYRCFPGDHVNIPGGIMAQQISLFHPKYNKSHYNILQKSFPGNKSIAMIPKHKILPKFIATASMEPWDELVVDESSVEDWSVEEDPDAEDMGTPWEGAILYERDPTVSHLEYCTTLERFGLGDYSTEESKSRASVMGLRVTKSVKDFPDGTPVIVSIDVTRKRGRLKLDGIVRTVLGLGCFRCGRPAPQPVFSNFSLLLSEEPIEESEMDDIEEEFDLDEFEGSSSSGRHQYEEDDDASIDIDDRFYFPPEEDVIDISKNVRDIVHLEISLDALCSQQCKGVCFDCGADLNIESCTCSEQEQPKGDGPFTGLKERLQL